MQSAKKKNWVIKVLNLKALDNAFHIVTFVKPAYLINVIKIVNNSSRVNLVFKIFLNNKIDLIDVFIV